MPRNTPVWLTATTSFHDVERRVDHALPPEDAGVVDQDVEPPVRVDHSRHQSGPLLGIGHVVLDERAPELGRGLLALVGEHVGDEHRRTLLGEEAPFGRALTARTARDDRHPAVELPHRLPHRRPVRGATLTLMGSVPAWRDRWRCCSTWVACSSSPTTSASPARSPEPSTRCRPRRSTTRTTPPQCGSGSTVDAEADWAGGWQAYLEGYADFCGVPPDLRRGGPPAPRQRVRRRRALVPRGPRLSRGPRRARGDRRAPRASCRTPTG